MAQLVLHWNLPMSVRKAGGNLPRNAGQRAVQAENKAEDREANMHESRNRDAGRARYLAPQKTSMEAARRAANAKKHEADLDDEATKHMHVDDESMMLKREEEVEEEQKLKGVNLDDERKKRGQRDGSKDDQDANEKEAKKKLGYDDGAGKFFEDVPEDRMGDLSLVDPNDMKRQLGPSVRFAQHAMILADERMKAGMPRQEALEFLANIYLGVHDRNYARKALSKFGAGTGILDIYPLELMEHLLKNVPSFAPKISAGRFFVDPPKKGGLDAGARSRSHRHTVATTVTTNCAPEKIGHVRTERGEGRWRNPTGIEPAETPTRSPHRF